jgi:hypothetical protein
VRLQLIGRGRITPEYSNNQSRHAAKEWAAGDTDQQQCSEEAHRFKAFPALALPIDVLQIEPERELVKREGGGNAVEH